MAFSSKTRAASTGPRILFVALFAFLLLFCTTVQLMHLHADGADTQIARFARMPITSFDHRQFPASGLFSSSSRMLLHLLRDPTANMSSHSHWNRPPPDQARLRIRGSSSGERFAIFAFLNQFLTHFINLIFSALTIRKQDSNLEKRWSLDGAEEFAPRNRRLLCFLSPHQVPRQKLFSRYSRREMQRALRFPLRYIPNRTARRAEMRPCHRHTSLDTPWSRSATRAKRDIDRPAAWRFGPRWIFVVGRFSERSRAKTRPPKNREAKGHTAFDPRW